VWSKSETSPVRRTNLQICMRVPMVTLQRELP
jgi:hypothetical protein